MKQIGIKRAIVSILILIWAAMLVIQIGSKNSIVGETTDNSTEQITIPSNIMQPLENGVTFTQVFVPEYAYITQFKTILLHTGDGTVGTLSIVITDENGKQILNKTKELSEMKPGEWSSFDVHRQVTDGKKHYLQLTVNDAQEAPTLMLINSAFGRDEQLECAYGETPVAGAILMTIGYKETKSLLFRSLVCVAIVLTAAFLIYLLNVKAPVARMQAILCDGKDVKKSVYIGCMLFLGVWILFLHCYKLLEVPYGLNVDEMGSGYDAYCLANWGVDRFRMSYPVYFINIGTGQNALYAYMAMVLFKIFGYSALMLRIPAVINAFLTVFFGAKIVRMKWKKRYAVLLFTALYSILPIFIMSTRFGLESYLMLGFSTLFLYTFLKAVESEKTIWFIISGVCAGIVLYTYAISYLVMVAFLLVMLIYLIRNKRVNIKQIVVFSIPLAIIGMPLVLCQLINMFDWPEMYLGPVTITKLEGYRGSEIEFDHLVSNFIETLKNIFMYDSLPYNSFPEYMTMYWVSIPFIFIGICHAFFGMIQDVRKRIWNVSTVMMFWFLCMIAIGCLLGGNGSNCNKINGAFIACIFFLVEGIFCIIRLCKKEKWAIGMLAVSAIAYFACFVNWADYYYYRYAKDIYPQVYFEPTYTDALNILNGCGDEIANRTTYIQEYSPIYYCGSTLISPYEIDYANGMNQYQNYVFRYSGEQDVEANYILRDSSKEDAIALEMLGFVVQKTDGWFVCYRMN